MAAWLGRRVSWWLALSGLILFIAFTATVLPWQADISASYSHGVRAPDTSFWYTAADLYAAAEAWGPDGRAAYVLARITFDVVWPLVYGFFLVTALAWLWARVVWPGRRWRRVALLPILVVLCDYAENACTATVIARYPERTLLVADLAALFTVAKWILLGSCFVLLAVGVVGAVLRWRRTRYRT